MERRGYDFFLWILDIFLKADEQEPKHYSEKGHEQEYEY